MATSKTPKKVSKRPLGFLRDEIWMAPDFDAPMELIESEKLRILEAEASHNRKTKAKPGGAAKKKSSLR
jgi:hypothetical protein